MEVLELMKELLPYILSILATIISFKKGGKTLTAEEIESRGEAKKQKYITKQCKKNKVDTFHSETNTASVETTTETSANNLELLGR